MRLSDRGVRAGRVAAVVGALCLAAELSACGSAGSTGPGGTSSAELPGSYRVLEDSLRCSQRHYVLGQIATDGGVRGLVLLVTGPDNAPGCSKYTNTDTASLFGLDGMVQQSELHLYTVYPTAVPGGGISAGDTAGKVVGRLVATDTLKLFEHPADASDWPFSGSDSLLLSRER